MEFQAKVGVRCKVLVVYVLVCWRKLMADEIGLPLATLVMQLVLYHVHVPRVLHWYVTFLFAFFSRSYSCVI